MEKFYTNIVSLFGGSFRPLLDSPAMVAVARCTDWTPMLILSLTAAAGCVCLTVAGQCGWFKIIVDLLRVYIQTKASLIRSVAMPTSV